MTPVTQLSIKIFEHLNVFEAHSPQSSVQVAFVAAPVRVAPVAGPGAQLVEDNQASWHRLP